MSSIKWKQENTVQIALRFTKKSGVPEAFEKMVTETGSNIYTYARTAIVEKLTKDGYMPDAQENQEE